MIDDGDDEYFDCIIGRCFWLTLCPSRLDCQLSVVLVKVCAEYRHVVQIGFCHLQLMHHSFIMDVSVPSR